MNGILAAAGIEPQVKSTRSRRLMAAAPAKGSELRSAGAYADEHVASRASRHGEAGGYRSLKEEARRVLRGAQGARPIDRAPAQVTLEEP